MPVNGSVNGLPTEFAGAKLISAAKYDFTELQARQVVAQVKGVVGSQGGQMPISDPAGILMLGVVLDKLAEISERLAELEMRASGGSAARVVLQTEKP